jgi:hypothetical protein
LNPKGQRRSQAAQAGEELWGHLVCEGTELTLGSSEWSPSPGLVSLSAFLFCLLAALAVTHWFPSSVLCPLCPHHMTFLWLQILSVSFQFDSHNLILFLLSKTPNSRKPWF